MATKKILVAEDERPLARALELKLGHSGFQVDVVGDGESALELARSNTYDMIILDLMMPKMDGFTVLQHLSADGNKTKVLVLSNLSQEVDKQKVTELGAMDLLVKSNTPLTEIVEYINSKVTE